MSIPSGFTQIGLYLLYILIPLLVLYIAYLIITKAFKDMGFSSVEAIIIVFASFLFGFEIIIFGFNISNIYLFSHENWRIAINMGGAVIPILLSVYLTIKKKISLKKIAIGIAIVTIIAFFVTQPVADRGIVASFPYWLFPAFFASLASVFLSWKDFIRAAPLAYISGTIGVLIGADFFHLPELLSYSTEEVTTAVIGGADVFDMIFITGIIAVLVDGMLMYRQKSKDISS
jgi:uncharacterized membrane protein